MPDRRRRQLDLLILAAILLLALVLRFHRLGFQSFWNDEGTSVALAQRDLATIVRNASNDIHPPLYYFALHYWLLVAGTSEAAARSLSALCGVALVLLTYTLSRRLLSSRSALLAAGLSALSPFLVYYSQEARMYIVVALLGSASTLAFQLLLQIGARETPVFRWRWGLAYALTSIAAIYTHYFAFALLLSQNIVFLAWAAARRHDRDETGIGVRRWVWRWVAIQGAVLLSYVPWLMQSWGALTGWPAVSDPLSLADLLLRVAVVFPLGLTAEPTRAARIYGLALLAVAAYGTVLGEKAPADGHRRDEGRLLIALYLLAPVLVMYLLSLQRPMYKPKFLLLAVPPYHILLAQGATLLGRRLGRLFDLRVLPAAAMTMLALALVLPVARPLHAIYYDPAYYRDDYRGIVQYIEATSGPDDAILINAPSQIETVDLYYSGPLPLYPLPLQRPLEQGLTRAALEDIATRHRRVYGIFWATAESDPERFVENWLDQHCFKAMDSWYGALRLAVYAVPQEPPRTMEHTVDYTLGDKIRLRGYTLLTPETEAGSIAQLTLYWEALGPIDARYKVFVHLVDAQGTILGQRDAEPGSGAHLTVDWQPEELIIDNYGVPVGQNAVPGGYRLRVGMYDLDDGQRLEITGDGGVLGDAIDLAPLRIVSSS